MKSILITYDNINNYDFIEYNNEQQELRIIDTVDNMILTFNNQLYNDIQKIINHHYNIIINYNKFNNLKYLDCGCNKLKELKINNLSKLEYLNCINNNLKELDLSNLINLKELYCGENELQILNLNDLINLKILDCQSNNLQYLNIKNLINLEYLHCSRSARHFFKLGLCPRFR